MSLCKKGGRVVEDVKDFIIALILSNITEIAKFIMWILGKEKAPADKAQSRKISLNISINYEEE